MSAEEKIKLITEIHNEFYNNTNTLAGVASEFLTYLYPAIAADKKCQLWGSIYDDVILYLFLQNNFPEEHGIWNFIECLEPEEYYVDAIYYARWKLNWEFSLETKCKYNVLKKVCFDLETDILNIKGELLNDWIIIDLGLNDFFEGYVLKIDNPKSECYICGRSYSECECETDE